MYLVIANKLKPLPYLESLLQKDEDTESEEHEDEKRLKQQHQQQPDSQKSELMQTGLLSASTQQLKPADMSTSYDAFDSDNLIDNPYLRPIVMPKLKVGSKKSR